MTALRPILLTVLFALSILIMGAGVAQAAIVKIEANTSMFQVASACGAAGGQFSVHEDGGYGCTKENCDGDHGDCHVGCDPDGNCTGSTPSKLDLTQGMTLFGLL